MSRQPPSTNAQNNPVIIIPNNQPTFNEDPRHHTNYENDPRFMNYIDDADRIMNEAPQVRLQTSHNEPKNNIVDNSYVPLKYIPVLVIFLAGIVSDSFVIRSEISQIDSKIQLHTQEYTLIIDQLKTKIKELEEEVREMRAQNDTSESRIQRNESQLLLLLRKQRLLEHN
ncbi:MAG: hypothetical protein DRG78_03400 [Epsilonproteobacteria bacterium]|nr:MAG: hypothetical protein DRG78_03400 [Campylobacterota bacterium]